LWSDTTNHRVETIIYHLLITEKLPAVAEIVGVEQKTVSNIIDRKIGQMSDFGKDFKPFIKKATYYSGSLKLTSNKAI